jgi:hypothetical protein
MVAVRWREVDQDGQLFVEEIHKVVVYRFNIGDVDDPNLYAAEPLYQWEKSEPGQFVMEHAIEQPIWRAQTDTYNYGYQCIIVAELEKKKLAEFYLKWGDPNGSSKIW